MDIIEQSVVEWSGTVYRQVFSDADVLRANIRGGRWNPPGVEAIYCSLDPRTAAAEIDYLVSQQPVPIRKLRVTHTLAIKLSNVANFENLLALEACDVRSDALMGDDLSAPQRLGEAVAWLQCGGMLIPSARDEGTNLVIFVNNMKPDDILEPMSSETYVPNDPGELTIL